jgi:hypothetical protein
MARSSDYLTARRSYRAPISTLPKIHLSDTSLIPCWLTPTAYSLPPMPPSSSSTHHRHDTLLHQLPSSLFNELSLYLSSTDAGSLATCNRYYHYIINYSSLPLSQPQVSSSSLSSNKSNSRYKMLPPHHQYRLSLILTYRRMLSIAYHGHQTKSLARYLRPFTNTIAALLAFVILFALWYGIDYIDGQCDAHHCLRESLLAIVVYLIVLLTILLMPSYVICPRRYHYPVYRRYHEYSSRSSRSTPTWSTPYHESMTLCQVLTTPSSRRHAIELVYSNKSAALYLPPVIWSSLTSNIHDEWRRSDVISWLMDMRYSGYYQSMSYHLFVASVIYLLFNLYITNDGDILKPFSPSSSIIGSILRVLGICGDKSVSPIVGSNIAISMLITLITFVWMVVNYADSSYQGSELPEGTAILIGWVLPSVFPSLIIMYWIIRSSIVGSNAAYMSSGSFWLFLTGPLIFTILAIFATCSTLHDRYSKRNNPSALAMLSSTWISEIFAAMVSLSMLTTLATLIWYRRETFFPFSLFVRRQYPYYHYHSLLLHLHPGLQPPPQPPPLLPLSTPMSAAIVIIPLIITVMISSLWLLWGQFVSQRIQHRLRARRSHTH